MDVIYRVYKNYDRATDSGEIWVECPTCEVSEEFETGIAADAWEHAHINSPSHIRRFYLGEK